MQRDKIAIEAFAPPPLLGIRMPKGEGLLSVLVWHGPQPLERRVRPTIVPAAMLVDF